MTIQKPKTAVLKKIGTFLGLPLVGAILMFGIQQFFFTENKRTEEAITIESEYVKSKFSLLMKVKKFQELSELYNTQHIKMSYIDDGIEWATDTIGYEIRLPDIAIDTSVQIEWRSLYAEFVNNEAELDRDLFKACQDLYLYIKINPFPKTNDSDGTGDFERYEYSGWNDFSVIGRWNTLIKTLKFKIDRRLRLVKEDSEFLQ